MWGGSGRTPRNDSIVQRDRLNILNTGSVGQVHFPDPTTKPRTLWSHNARGVYSDAPRDTRKLPLDTKRHRILGRGG